MIGERPSVVAQKFNLSRPRIAQLRRQFHDDWMCYVDELTINLLRNADAHPAAPTFS